MKTTKEVYLSIQQFNSDLEKSLTILREPSKRKPYYVCSSALYKSIVHIYIK
jgi:hypothetical protein